jgi:type II secretory pathway pseudopilin PulG
MELMVVIVIVAILAAVAVPLYINYVKDAQRTEAKGAIGAIISAQQVYYQKSSLAGAPNYADNLQELKDSGALDLTEVEGKWEFEVMEALTVLPPTSDSLAMNAAFTEPFNHGAVESGTIHWRVAPYNDPITAGPNDLKEVTVVVSWGAGIERDSLKLTRLFLKD